MGGWDVWVDINGSNALQTRYMPGKGSTGFLSSSRVQKPFPLHSRICAIG
jgi:hypothetical protein